MSWYKALSITTALMMLGVGLSACGFHPLYGEGAGGSTVDAKLATVRVLSIADRSGQELTNQLRDSFNPRGLDATAVYQLEVRLSTTKGDIIARTNGTATRTNTSVNADWALRRLADNQVVAQGSSNSANGHDILTNDYANVVATQHDFEVSVRDVGEDIQTRVAIYLQNAS